MTRRRGTCLAAAAFALAFALCAPALSQEFSGAERYFVEMPYGRGPHPLLVIAPALRYDATQPLFTKLAEGAKALGYGVVLMQWKFFVEQARPSPDLSQEASELAAVLSRFSRDPLVDPSRIVLATKSFGVKVVMRKLPSQPKAFLLITPNCDAKETFRKALRPLFLDRRPVHISISTADPYCDVRQIYGALDDLGLRVALHTLAGDHNFLLKGSGSTAQQDAALSGMLAWLERQK